MDKTYVESLGYKSFDWNKALDGMIELSIKTTDPQQASILHHKAMQWTSCACGNQCAIIPRLPQGRLMGRPMDISLQNLGIDFLESINGWKWAEAKDILKRIEKRSAYLIKIELAKLNQNLVNEK